MLNLLFDGRIFNLVLNEFSARAGIYFVSKNIFNELCNRNDVKVFLYLPKEAEERIEDIKKEIDISNCKILLDNDDFSHIHSYFSPYDKKLDFIEKYPKISSYTMFYDVIPLILFEYYVNMPQYWFHDFIKSINADDYYFTISENTKKDFLRLALKANPAHTETSLIATNHKYNRNKDTDKLSNICKKYNIPTDKKYIFSLCSLEPRKNLEKAVKNFISFIRKHNIKDMVYVLGGNDWSDFTAKLKSEIDDFEKYEDVILRVGYIDDEDLEVLYSNSYWFIYTSKYEGFGMPLLEAMSCGCPVIGADNSSMPEVVADCGILVNCDSDEEHILAYEKYYYDDEYRKNMAEKGYERSKLFSWQSTVDVMLKKMQEVEAKKLNKPLVSIITSTYNIIENGRKDFLKQNIESVKNQSYQNIEHIIIDGESTDNTIELLDEYKNNGHITYFIEKNNGIYDLINKGILKAKGKYILCLNSNDLFCDNMAVEYLVAKIEELEADACFANANICDSNTLKVIKEWNGKDLYKPLVSIPCHQTFIIKKDIIEELGFYNTNYKMVADIIFILNMVTNNKKIVNINKTIISCRDINLLDVNSDIVKKEQVKAIYEEYGKYNNFSYLDILNLVYSNYKFLDKDNKINLITKVINTKNQVLIESVLQDAIKYGNDSRKIKNILLPYINFIKKSKLGNFLLKTVVVVTDELINNVSYKVINIFGIKIKIRWQ